MLDLIFVDDVKLEEIIKQMSNLKVAFKVSQKGIKKAPKNEHATDCMNKVGKNPKSFFCPL